MNNVANLMMNELSESQRCLYEKLYSNLGEVIKLCLQDKDINEVMLNPDGKLWVDSSSQGLLQVSQFNRAAAFSIIHDVARIHDFVVTPHNPCLEAELPFFKLMQGERFTAQIPPIVSSPSFTICKKSEVIFQLEDYVATQRLTTQQAIVLKDLIRHRKNILVCGEPRSGKTTFTNALMSEAVKCNEYQRFIILEDLPELQCSAPNQVAMKTSDEVNMTGLLRLSMRMRPDRILIGEVRGREAFDLLKAWDTNCPGGICTVHANGAEEALQRMLDLAMEAGLTVPPIPLVLHTIDSIIFVTRQNHQKGFIQDILALENYENANFTFKKLA